MTHQMPPGKPLALIIFAVVTATAARAAGRRLL
jgi:hypothetical protein